MGCRYAKLVPIFTPLRARLPSHFRGVLPLWCSLPYGYAYDVLFQQESPIEGAVSSKEGPGWWKVLDEVFYTE